MKYIYILLFLIPGIISAQRSWNGGYITNDGMVRCLVVFYSFSDLDPNATMPDHPEKYFNVELPTNQNELRGLTKYFYNASMGKVILLGDYYREVLFIDTLTSDPHGIIEALDALPVTDITTPLFSVNDNDFDLWNCTSRGVETDSGADGKLDLLVLIDINGYFHDGGGIQSGAINTSLKNMTGVRLVTSSGPDKHTNRHEIAHLILGNNQFHAGGRNAGHRMTLSPMGGYSMLSGSNSYNLPSVNAWDRWRMGWLNEDPGRTTDIYAKRNNSYVDSDIDPEDGTQTFVLRDFMKYGDAVRIELPHIGTEDDNTQANKQWIWLENHQMLPAYEESTYTGAPKGIRANIQIGNNNRDQFSNSREIKNHYISPLCPFGNYDFSFLNIVTDHVTDKTKADIETESDMANPFTGCHYMMDLPVDRLGEGAISRSDFYIPRRMYFNGVLYDHNNFFREYNTTKRGSVEDAFQVGDKITIATNPASVSWMTYSSKEFESCHREAQREDNRYIYLSGLKIEVVRDYPNAEGNGRDIEVRVSWNNYDIDRDVRWCGNIVLNEEIVVKSGKTLVLDQGLTPTKATDPISFNGQQVFADPTILKCNPGSRITIEDGAKLIVRNGSKLLLEPDANIDVEGTGQIIIECTGQIECKAIIPTVFSHIYLNSPESSVLEYDGCISNNWSYYSGSNPYTGSGKVIKLSADKTISTRTYTVDIVEGAKALTTTGTVKVQSGKLDVYAREVIFDGTFEVSPGAEAEFHMDTYDCD